jgi:membrane dipeptidase
MIPVIDGHNDLAYLCREHRDYSVAGIDQELEQSQHTDIPKLRRGGVGGQFWSVWVHTDLEDQVRATMEQVDFVQRMIHAYPATFEKAVTADDVERIMAAGKVASLIGVEGSNQIEGSLAVLRILASLGARYLTLTWNENTEFADSNAKAPEHGGLSARGVELVAEMNRIGMVVDLSHVSADTMRDALAASTLPVMFSHSSCFGLNPHPRNVPDDVMRTLATNGGIQMITFVPSFLSADYTAWARADSQDPAPEVTIEHVVQHIEYARDVMGVDHIGLGGDFDGFSTAPVGLEDVSKYQALFEILRAKGWSEDDVHKLGHRNVERVLHDNDAAYLQALA